MAMSPEERKARQREADRRWYQANAEKKRDGHRRWREANPERKRELDRRWREANPELSREKARQWREANPERCREMNRSWKESNPEWCRENMRRWREANPERHRAHCRASQHRRRIRKRGPLNTGLPLATAKSVAVRFALFGHRCGWCGVDGRMTEDHFIPIAKGGQHTPRNILPACPTCNFKRQDKMPASWYLSQPFFSIERWEFICRHCDYDGGGAVQLDLLSLLDPPEA